MTLKLVLGSNVLDFDDWEEHGIIITSVDLGFPTPREVMTNLPGQDGELDETAYLGPRVVTLQGNAGLGAIGSRSQAVGVLAPFLNPKARPQLVYSADSDTPDRTLTLRAADYTGPVSSGSTISFSVSWKCPDPIAYGAALNEIDVPPATAGTAGRTYPRTFPQTYPVSLGGGGMAFITTDGNYPAWPVIRIDGPALDPVITWLDPSTRSPLGTRVAFAGLSIAAGDFLKVDTKARTVLLNGDPNANRFSYLDFEATQWGALAAGLNLLRFSSAFAPPPAVAKVFWRDASLI